MNVVTTAKDEMVFDEIRQEWRAIARSEVSRHRRKLGLLSPQQESAVESVLVDIADQLFGQLFLERVPQPLRRKCLNVWRRNAVAA